MSEQMIRERSVDVAVIGAGTAGLAAYRAAVAVGRGAVLIEGGAHGTTCARVGCMPSKLLIAAAEVAYGFDMRARLGFGQPSRSIGRAATDCGRNSMLRGLVVAGVERIPSTDRITGYARFLAPGVLTSRGALCAQTPWSWRPVRSGYSADVRGARRSGDRQR